MRSALDPATKAFSLHRVAGGPGRREFAERIVRPQLEVHAWFVSLDATVAGKKYRVHAIVKEGATAGDPLSLVDPITGTFRVLHRRIEAFDSDSVSRDFNDGFGRHVAHYEATVSCVGPNGPCRETLLERTPVR